MLSNILYVLYLYILLVLVYYLVWKNRESDSEDVLLIKPWREYQMTFLFYSTSYFIHYSHKWKNPWKNPILPSFHSQFFLKISVENYKFLISFKLFNIKSRVNISSRYRFKCQLIILSSVHKVPFYQLFHFDTK